jgi:hypothetical protein
MNLKHAMWMFLAVFSGGMAVSGAWDLISGRITDERVVHILLLALFLGASVFFFMTYFKARNAQQQGK